MTMTPTFEDLDVMARTVYGEARGEIPSGQIAVAWVVRNRADRASAYHLAHGKPHPLFGDGTIRMACKWPSQFSCWNQSDPMRPKLLAAKTATLAACLQAAYGVLSREFADPTGGALHYYAASMPEPPKWAAGLTPCAVIGAHRFFNDVS
jgi:spore germination cell wall hydrolase CwlJ-like protein